jgi:hypothetical protein
MAQLDTTARSYSFPHAYFKKDSNTVVLFFASRTGCKSFALDSISFPDPRRVDVMLLKTQKRGASSPVAAPLLRVHGNIAYSFDYRSELDTPFATSNLQQHHEQVYADATLKGKYPFRVVLDSRQTNSPFFKNYTDINIEFKHQAYQQGLKESMIAEMTAKTRASDSLGKYDQVLNAQKAKYAALTSWLADPARRQDIVQEKEQLYHQVVLLSEQQAKNALPKDSTSAPGSNPLAMPGPSLSVPVLKDSLNARLERRKDSLLALMRQPGPTEQNMATRKKSADSLARAMLGTQGQSDSARAKEDSTIKAMTASIRNAKSISELEAIGKTSGTSALSGSDKALLGVTHFNIGRSSVNYSDLTVNNISLTGVNIEYNPSWYTAFAAGSVDYLFRDFVVAPGSLPKQNLVLGRLGWGNKEKQIFILTVYTGTKNSFGGNAIVIPASGQAVSTTSVFGYSFEAKYKLDPNKVFSFEAAKSSSPYGGGTGRGKSFGDAFAYANHNNQAYTAKFDLNIPVTHSSFNLFYKEVGASFQSYSVFNTGNRQTGWGIKWRQYLFRNQLSATVQVKKSTFDDPLIVSTYSSTMLFKSLQLVYRHRKWPVFSLGYMPSTQLTKDSAGNLVQNIFYALTATAVYSYAVKKLRMSSSLMYSQFYNKGTDSGFVLYNARDILYTHQVYWGKLNTQTDIQYTQQPALDYWMFQQGANVGIGKYVSVGASVKNDRVTGGQGYWGGGLQAQVNFKKVGSLRLQYSKDYIPNGTSTLVPYNWGRANWIKVF